MIWLVLIWTVLIVLWVNAERFTPAAKLADLWRHATGSIVRATPDDAEPSPSE